ncbi:MULTISPECIES: CHASE2 domain-containing protein [unclassified Leptolyngbya]|uniref:CHASE2 domain-containing protein n=1 Tax=unclassified Leptolyngbya TaxID=2650499 RepID=UPI001684B3C6
MITVDQQDEDWQRNTRMKGLLSGQTISDEALSLLLQKLQSDQARVIGLDIYRDFPVHAEVPVLAQQLQMERLVSICKSAPGKDTPPISAPSEAKWVGFSDFVADTDGTLRRQLLAMPPHPKSPCPDTIFSFSSQVAFQYFSQDQLYPTFDEEKQTFIGLGDRYFAYLFSPFNGYISLPHEGDQLLLNYRSIKSGHTIADTIPLREFLTSPVDSERVKNRIVLIGVTDVHSTDRHITPLGKMPGVMIHAHMISQLLSAVYDHRPLIWVWQTSVEKAWIGLWAIVGGLSAWRFRSSKALGVVLTLEIAVLTASCFVVFLLSGWIPWVPAVLALSLSGLGVALSRPASIDLNHHLCKFLRHLPKPS